MKKILLPTDFSENAYNAIRYGVQLFKDQECIFYLLNTYTPVLYDSNHILYNRSSRSLISGDVQRKYSFSALTKISKRIAEESPNSEHTFKIISSYKTLNEEITKQVKKKKIDLVIMGTQGAAGTEQKVFGTNTVHAIKRTTCPLLAIPSDFTFKKPEKILFATDYQINYSSEKLALLKEIAGKEHYRIYILNVKFGLGLKPDIEEPKQLLNKYFSGINHQFCSIERNTVPEGIFEFQMQKNIDMLAMISNKHSFFEKLFFRPVPNEIGFQIKIPFLVIPSGQPNT